MVAAVLMDTHESETTVVASPSQTRENREDFAKQLETLVKAIRPDDQDFTTIEHIRDGLAGRGGKKVDREGIDETEWVSHLGTSKERTSFDFKWPTKSRDDTILVLTNLRKLPHQKETRQS